MRILFLFCPIILFSQSLAIKSELDTTQGFIGDIIQWTILVEGKKMNQRIHFPELKNDNNDLIKIKKKNNKIDNNGFDQIHFEITVWDTGTFFTPDYSIEVLGENGNVDYTLKAEPLQISIFSILSSLGESEFQPIKGPVPVQGIFPLRQILLIILLIVILICLVITWRKRKKITYQKIDYKIIETPYKKAIRRLNELDESSLTKEYYTKLSHITREFVEAKYFIRTLEMNTSEIQRFREFFPINDSLFNNWIRFLHEADKVKYAREIPKPDKLISDKEMIFNLIDEL